MLFSTFSNPELRFAKRKLVLRTYSDVKALPITQRVEIIDKKEFATATLNKDDETFVVHMIALTIEDSNVHLFWHTQIAC